MHKLMVELSIIYKMYECTSDGKEVRDIFRCHPICFWVGMASKRTLSDGKEVRDIFRYHPICFWVTWQVREPYPMVRRSETSSGIILSVSG